MEEKVLKPQLRFKGFNGDWEERKFLQTIHIERGGSPRPIEDFITTSENGLNWIKIGDAPEMGKYITKTAEKIRPEGLSKTREVHPGDLILSNSMSFGRPYIMTINGCIHDGWLLLRNDRELYNLQFLCYLLTTENMLQQYKSFAAGSTVNNLNKELVGNTTVSYPSKTEQSKIGTFFSSLDNLITLEQRKLDKLGYMKKALLEKMFPKNNSHVPEIRFKGFDEAWEWRKLNEVSDVRDGTHDSPKYQNTGHPFITSKNVKNGYITYDDIQYISDEDFKEINKRSKVDVNDILMGMIGTIGNMALIRTEPDFAIKNVALIKDTKQVNYLYLYHFLQSPYIEKQLTSEMDGGTQKFVSLGNVRNLDVLIPSGAEQSKIGDFFNSLDNLITLEQLKLEKLKNIKKSCLNKMFV